MAIADKVNLTNTPTYLFFFATPLILFYLTSILTSLLPVNRCALAKLLITPRLAGVAPRIGLCALETRHMLLESVDLFKNTTSE
jgi:hypothetical protein